jgi:Chaperone of endosialidase
MRKTTVIIVTMLFFVWLSPALPFDFNGDGKDDVTIYRSSSGLWAVRGVSRVYFGGAGDEPVPGDYDGDRTDDFTIWRASAGLWAARGVTRVYFGGAGDIPIGSGGGGTSSLWKTGLGGIYTFSDLGIGISAPLSIFHIEANQSESIILGVGATSREADLLLYRGGSNETFIGPSSSNQFNLLTRENIPIVIGNSLTERMRIDTNGDVGIGTSSPTSKLHIKGSSNTIIRIEGHNSSSEVGFLFNHSGESWPRAEVIVPYIDDHLGLWTSRGTSLTRVENMRLTSSAVGIKSSSQSYTLNVAGTAGKTGGGYWTATCDGRMKKKIEPIDRAEALDKICRLEGYTYAWVNPDEHGRGRVAGVVAQNIEEVFPDWVVEIPPEGKDRELMPEGEMVKAVSFPNDFNAYLIETFRELRDRNESLKLRIAALEARAQ